MNPAATWSTQFVAIREQRPKFDIPEGESRRIVAQVSDDGRIEVFTSKLSPTDATAFISWITAQIAEA
jgi:hypothetical protein